MQPRPTASRDGPRGIDEAVSFFRAFLDTNVWRKTNRVLPGATKFPRSPDKENRVCMGTLQYQFSQCDT
jgi:hypothetical protein